MNKNYFAIECNQQYWEHVVLKDQDGNVKFEDYLNKTYDEMKSSEDLGEFVVAVMDAANGDTSNNTIITLIGEDGVFIWGIIMGPDEEDGVRYVLIDWKKDGKSYRYES
jgi:hypothetical protein